MEHMRKLVAHMRWADDRAMGALRGAGDAGAEALALYAHILGAEHTWLSRIRGEAPRYAVWPELDLDGCAALARETHAVLESLAASLDERALARPVTYRNSAGDEFTSTVEDMLLQVALHGSYHRGQIARDLRRSGATPLATDYIAWARGAPAATRR